MWNPFKPVKLTIAAYATEERSPPEKKLEVQFNPESYSLAYKNTFNRGQGINTQGAQLTYGVSLPQELALRLVMDSTGVAGGPRGQSAYDQVNAFLQTVYKISGTTHEPAYLKLTWGKLTFICRLSSADVRYTLLGRNGTPLRAELDVKFTGDMEDPTGSRIKNSPDLTHYRVAKAGDLLPLLCQEIYGSTAHCAMVARVNRLNSLRSLKPGLGLVFPPLT